MERYNVLVVGYTFPDVNKIKELIIFEKSWLKRECKDNHKILIFAPAIMKETEIINNETYKKYKKGREEYNLAFSDLNCKPDENGLHKIILDIEF